MGSKRGFDDPKTTAGTPTSSAARNKLTLRPTFVHLRIRPLMSFLQTLGHVAG